VSVRPHAEVAERVRQDLADHATALPWSTPQKLALACRILALEGHESGLAGQFTARADAAGTFWTLPFGVGFDEASEDGLIRVDDDLQPLDGAPMANPAVRFHLWIYRTRPEIGCIIHTHPPHVSALSMIGEPLAVAHMDATPLYDDCAYLAEWPGVPVHDEEGRLISAALGSKRAILLAHHGQLAATGSVEEAAVIAIQIERAARLHLLARAAGPIKEIAPERAKEAHDFLLSPVVVNATFAYYARRALRVAPDCISADNVVAEGT